MTLILQSLVEEWRQRIAGLEQRRASRELDWLGEVQLKVLHYMWSRYAHDPRYQTTAGARPQPSPLLTTTGTTSGQHIRRGPEFRQLLEDIHHTWLHSRTTI